MRQRIGVVIGIGIAAIVILYTFSQTGGGTMEYNVHDLKSKVENNENMVVLDVRTPQEYTGELGHIHNSVLIPVQELQRRVGELEQYRDKEVVVICRTDNRSRVAASILMEHGFDNVAFVRGGMVDWNRQFGYPQNNE